MAKSGHFTSGLVHLPKAKSKKHSRLKRGGEVVSLSAILNGIQTLRPMYLCGGWRKLEMLRLEQESNPHPCILGQFVNHYMNWTPWCHHPTHSYPHVSPCLRCQCKLLHSSPVVSCLLHTCRHTYIQAVILNINTQGRFNNHTAHSLYRILVI